MRNGWVKKLYAFLILIILDELYDNFYFDITSAWRKEL